jgi:two-component system phosphate regulon sensor histidine kinase PhoR
MTLSLRARLFLLHSLVVAAALALVTALTIREQRAWLVERHFDDLERTAARVAAALPAEPARRPGGIPALADTLGALLGARVTLIDPAGHVLGDSEVPHAALARVENHATRPEVAAALAGRPGRARRYSATVGMDQLYEAMPLRGIDGLAVIRLAEPRARIAGLEASQVRLALAAALSALFLSVPLVLWATGRHVARLALLERTASRLAAGEADTRAREQPADELGRLGRAINAMAAERRARLEALERERDERERILASMSDGVALIGSDGRIARMNRALAELLGQPLPAAPGTPLAEYARVPELDDLLAQVRAEGTGHETELRLWGPRPRLVRASATPLAGGGAGALLLVVHDLSEAETLARVRQDFVANAAHELRTPLTSLRGYAETLLDGGLEDREHREDFVRVIRDQAVRLEALVADLLSLAELERPGATLRLEAFDLREAAARVASALRPRALEAGLAFEFEPGAPLAVRADHARIEQVLANLIDNAIKYTERGRVTVRLGGDGARVWCEVADTGPGIPPEDQPRIFERFYRVEKARSREKGGTGLGLSIVKHIVTLHGGGVSVESRPGEGSVFRFEIPCDPAGAPARRG